jgi:hypothetical protein
MQVIQHQELASAQASITFSSIPQTFTDLVLMLSLRATASGTNVGAVSFNGSTSNFSLRLLQGDGSGVSSANYSANYAGIFGGSTMTANTFGNATIYIPNYAGSTNKSFSVDAVTENNATLAFQNIQAGLWSNTAAITSIAISFLSGGDWAQYSSATLYGITKGSDGIVTVS